MKVAFREPGNRIYLYIHTASDSTLHFLEAEPGRYAVGLGADPPTAAELARIVAQWVVPGVRVEWTAKAPVLRV